MYVLSFLRSASCRVPRPLYSFDAGIQILTKIYCSHQYLSIDPKKKVCNSHFKAHKLKKNCKYERGYLGNYQRKRIGISDLDSVALYAAQVCYANMTHQGRFI